ncbi:MAG: (d)CMP kinase [Bacilli bacterium]|nr:(d)CMP kinase [Bacilli bacterium]MDD3841226.1 (d)CMP kinase [Bacilli bacterium]HKM10007.1 (d)CMP kinase [Bacilli bacterium]
MMTKIAVAIDGPAAAGKSTVAKKVAEIKGFTYIDTGAMYRAFTWYCLEKGIDCQDEKACVSLIPEIHIELKPNHIVLCNGQDVSKEIRETRVSSQVSYIASYKGIRLALVESQRKMAEKDSVIMDGRDIGTYVLPNAEVKIFQIASVETRAVRRYEENLGKGIKCTLEEIDADVRKRDYIDSHREFAPLKAAPDAVLLDTSYMTVDEVVKNVLDIIDEKMKEK